MVMELAMIKFLKPLHLPYILLLIFSSQCCVHGNSPSSKPNDVKWSPPSLPAYKDVIGSSAPRPPPPRFCVYPPPPANSGRSPSFGAPGAPPVNVPAESPLPPAFLPPVAFPPQITPAPPSGMLPGVWCVANPTVANAVVQAAMDYACGSGADCDMIAPGGLCYLPDTLMAHASFAFNSYWQRTKVAGGTCDFAGAAMLITRDPSYI